MNDQSLTSLLDMIWQQLGRGTSDRHHPARHMTLATTTPNGPEIRTLVLRRTSRAEAVLEFHTDAASPKVQQILDYPLVALHVWIPKSNLQFRANATASIRAGDPSLFSRLPEAAQQNYQGPAPGALLPAEADTTPNRFTSILCNLTKIDALHLSSPHKRAIYTPSSDWRGQWIAP